MIDSAGKGIFRRNVRWQFVGSLGQAFLSGGLLLLMGRVLGPERFGTFSIIMSYVYVANLLGEPRIQDVAAKQLWDIDRNEPAEHHRHRFIDLFAIEALAKLLPAVALIALASWLAPFGGLPAGSSVSIILAACGLYLTRLGSGLAVGSLRVLGRTDIYALCVIGELGLRLLLIIGLVATSRLSVFSCVVALSVSGTIFNVIQWLATARQISGVWGGLQTWSVSHAVGRVVASRRMLLSNVGLSASDMMSKDLDLTIMSAVMPTGEVGIYKMAKNITLLTWRAVDPFYLALMPEVNRLVALRWFPGLQRLLFKCSLGLAGLAVCLSIASYVALGLAGDAVLGPEFGETHELLPWMLVGIVFSAPLIWGHPLAVALDRADIAFAGSLLGLVVGVGAMLLLAPTYGVYGAAAAWSLTFLSGFTLTAALTQFLLRERVRADA